MATTTQQGSGPPPKPWEGANSSSGPAPFRPPSAGTTSDVVEASGTAKPGEIVATSNQNNNTVNTNVAGRPLPTRPWENNYGNSSYGGYGSGLTSGLTYNSGYGTGYGSGMYNSYGGGYGGVGGVGGMYGNSMYRGGYGGGGLGSGMYGGGGMYNSGMGGPMGGYGMGGPYGPQDPNNPPASPPGFWISFLRVMEGVVNVFGRISFLVDQNTQAVHFFMTALLQFAAFEVLFSIVCMVLNIGHDTASKLFNQGGMLYGELARFVFRILGARRKSRKLNPTGSNGLPLPGPDTQMDQRFIEGPKAGPPTGSWDNVWG